MIATRPKHDFRVRGACKSAFLSRSSEVLVSGPAGTGKSRAILEKIHLMAMMNPNSRYLIVRKTHASMANSAMVTWQKEVIVEALLSGEVTYFGGSAREQGYYYKNGSFVGTAGMDKNSKIMSSQYDVIYVQEAIELTEDDWEALTTRLRNGVVSFQQIIGDTNPAEPTHWLKRRSEDGRLLMLYSTHTDNPRWYEDGILTADGAAYIERLGNNTGVRRARFLEGKWVAAEGIIYEDFDPNVHLKYRFDIPQAWTRWWSVDFGFTHPFVLQCWAEDPDGRLYLYREIYQTKGLVENHAKNILAIVAPGGKWIEPRPRAIVTDHDAEGRGTLEKYLGMHTVAAHKAVTEGIQAVQARLKVAADGKPRLCVLRDSVVHRDPMQVESKKPASTEEEFSGYVWQDNKEAPVKEADDGMDAMRYIVAHRDLKAHGQPFRGMVGR